MAEKILEMVRAFFKKTGVVLETEVMALPHYYSIWVTNPAGKQGKLFIPAEEDIFSDSADWKITVDNFAIGEAMACLQAVNMLAKYAENGGDAS